jgi:hypothetical protein
VSAPRYRAWAKAIEGETGPPRRSPAWATARRGWFRCYQDRVECGDWVIPASDVREPVLYEARQWFLPVHVLAVSTRDRAFQFGFNPWSRVASRLPFAVRRERVRLGYSPVSIAARVVLGVWVAWWLWRVFHD